MDPVSPAPDGRSEPASSQRARRPIFSEDTAFQQELWRRVEDHLKRTGRRERDCPAMYLKTAIILSSFVVTYVLLVFFADSLWQALPLAALLALITAAIGFNIQHDGGHKAYSDRPWINSAAAYCLDLVGSSSYRWHFKHTILHHMYVNIDGFDNDIDIGPLARYSVHQPRRWYHRWQHLYIWPFYGLLAVKLQLFDDFRFIATGRFGKQHIGRPTGRPLALMIAGKALFIGWAFVLPMIFHPVTTVLFFYAFAVLLLGISMVLVFIIPHLVDKSEFPRPDPQSLRLDVPFAVHQARVTVNFARGNRILTWLLGGLNYHKEHHLFPTLSHVNYAAISQVVEETCRYFNIPYHVHGGFAAGIAAHYRWLRRLGQA